jgi:hypothetical protein
MPRGAAHRVYFDTQPQPIARASVAAQRRRNRSSIARDNHLLYFRRIAAMLVTHLDYD